jgi:hypothetical protein
VRDELVRDFFIDELILVLLAHVPDAGSHLLKVHLGPSLSFGGLMTNN